MPRLKPERFRGVFVDIDQTVDRTGLTPLKCSECERRCDYGVVLRKMKRYLNILLIADANADYADLRRAAVLASNNQAALTVCAVLDDLPTDTLMVGPKVTPEHLFEIATVEKKAELEKAVNTVVEGAVPATVTVRVGRPYLEIIRQVLEYGHDLVIKNSEVTGVLQRKLFGSTDMNLMRQCPCPVWIINADKHPQYRRILAAVDLDADDGGTKDALNREILEAATALALAEFSELHVVHAWEYIGEHYMRSPRSGLSEAEVDTMISVEANTRRRWLENLVETYGNNSKKGATDYLKPRLHVTKGNPKHVIPGTVRDLDPDLLVMGTVARSGIPGFFMGNTAEDILNRVDCSVLTLKPPGFTGPVSI